MSNLLRNVYDALLYETMTVLTLFYPSNFKLKNEILMIKRKLDFMLCFLKLNFIMQILLLLM